MLEDALLFKPGEHHAHCQITRRIREARADLFSRGAITEREDRVQDFALATGQVIGVRYLSQTTCDRCHTSSVIWADARFFISPLLWRAPVARESQTAHRVSAARCGRSRCSRASP